MRIIIAALALGLATTAGGQEPAAPTTIDDLAWMAGAWTQTDDRGVTTRETWLAPLGGAMAGVGQTTRPGGRTSFEFMSITPSPAGPTFTARLEGQTPTPFVRRPAPAGEAVFENLDHDFPQRVIYRPCGEDLCGRIEGVVDGQARAIDWRYARVR